MLKIKKTKHPEQISRHLRTETRLILIPLLAALRLFTAASITENTHPRRNPRDDVTSEDKHTHSHTHRDTRVNISYRSEKFEGSFSYWCASCQCTRRCLQSRLALTPSDTSRRNTSTGCSASSLHRGALPPPVERELHCTARGSSHDVWLWWRGTGKVCMDEKKQQKTVISIGSYASREGSQSQVGSHIKINLEKLCAGPD